MSTHKIVVVKCDGCGTTALNPTMIIQDAINMEHPIDGVVEARSHARHKGWIHDKLGRDFCDKCRTFPAPHKPKIRIPHPHWH